MVMINYFSGDEWKAMRSTMSPAFTSSKIRLMVPFMEEVCLEMIKVLKQRIKDSGTSHYDMECKEVMTRYANDVIASCAFGLKVESLTADSEFYLNSKSITKFTFWRFMKIMFYRLLPSVAQMMKLSLVPKETTDYFTNVVLGTMKNREKNKIVRNDMINILMEVKKGQLTHEKEDKDADAGFATVEESHIGKKQHNYGSRFALCEVKVMLYLLLRDLKLTTCEKTCIPARLSKNGFEMLIFGGAWVRLSVRTE
ncbi:hypothetical protein HF086_012118 [Spodoptera exigua]|uniref:unspecific monooxygenase n=1 Tax=Spodoptera exigua TaxID=7107 RepID=A0A922MZN5_SPOEX|nr:hypothetical protein HF086_012118 [Spodoptera exigua]